MILGMIFSVGLSNLHLLISPKCAMLLLHLLLGLLLGIFLGLAIPNWIRENSSQIKIGNPQWISLSLINTISQVSFANFL